MNPYAAPAVPADEDARTSPAFQVIAAKSIRGEGLLAFPLILVAFGAPRHIELLKGYGFDSGYLVWLTILISVFGTSLLRRFFLSRLKKDICRYPIVHSGEALSGGPVRRGWSLRGKGYLFLTRQGLVYSLRGGRWDGEESFSIPLSEIESVTRSRCLRIDQNAILIHLRSGKVQRFSTSDPLTWIDGIVTVRRMQSA